MGGKLSDDMLASTGGGESCPSAYEEYCALFPGAAAMEGYGFAWTELESALDMVW